MSDLYILFESAAGYALFQKMELEQIGTEEDTVQAAMADKGSFSKVYQCHDQCARPRRSLRPSNTRP